MSAQDLDKEQCFYIFLNRIASSLSFPYPQLSSALIPSHFSMGKCLSLAGQWDPQPPIPATMGTHCMELGPEPARAMESGPMRLQSVIVCTILNNLLL